MRQSLLITSALAAGAIALLPASALAQDDAAEVAETVEASAEAAAGDAVIEDAGIVSEEIDLDEIASQIPERAYHPARYRENLIASYAYYSIAEPYEYLASRRSLCPSGGSMRSDFVSDPLDEIYAGIALDIVVISNRLFVLGAEPEWLNLQIEEFERTRLAAASAYEAGEIELRDIKILEYRAMEALVQAIISNEPELIGALDLDDCFRLRREPAMSAPEPSASPPPPPPPARPAPSASPPRSAAPRRPTPSAPAAMSRQPRGAILRVTGGPASVYLINRFSFQVCRARDIDPWDREECRWNEVETGRSQNLSGRFVYQVVWEDGTERRGTRVLDRGVHTFRKEGS